MHLFDEIVQNAHEFASLRKDIHAHPELSFEENRTADLVIANLTRWGIEYHRGLGKTGVVGIIKSGSSNKAIGLRADMDALPMQEANEFPHKSTHTGKMHACGHDGHVAMLLAAAQYLVQHKNTFDGTVYLIFQPAEEGGGGAREMIKDGLFEKFPMQAVYGIHNWPGMKEGQLAIAEGPVMGSSNDFKITLSGKGGHAAMPHNTIDPIPAACHMVLAFQSIIARNKKPLDSAVLSVTMIHTGEADNVVPDTCVIQGTARTFTLEVLDLIEKRMRSIVQHTCAAFDLTYEFEFHRNYPPTINHAKEAQFFQEVATEVLNPNNVLKQEPTMGAEDFSYMLLEKPGCYAFLGNGEGAHRHAGHGLGPCTLHNPSYDFNDKIIPVGASIWVKLVQRSLSC